MSKPAKSQSGTQATSTKDALPKKPADLAKPAGVKPAAPPAAPAEAAKPAKKSK